MVPGILYRNTEIEETGLSCGVMGHPANGVAWLANKLSTLGYALEPGQILLAGSFVRPVWAEVGDTIRADFGELGSVAIQFI
jgi:2-oxo-hept-3-ene-1,7-dioate hydratase